MVALKNRFSGEGKGRKKGSRRKKGTTGGVGKLCVFEYVHLLKPKLGLEGG